MREGAIDVRLIFRQGDIKNLIIVNIIVAYPNVKNDPFRSPDEAIAVIIQLIRFQPGQMIFPGIELANIIPASF